MSEYIQKKEKSSVVKIFKKKKKMHPFVSLGWAFGIWVFTFSQMLKPEGSTKDIEYPIIGNTGHVTFSFNKQTSVFQQFKVVAEYSVTPQSADFDIFYGNTELRNVKHRKITDIKSNKVTIMSEEAALSTVIIDGDFSNIKQLNLIWDGFYSVTNFRYYFMLFAFSILFFTLIYRETMVWAALFGVYSIFVVFFNYIPWMTFFLRLCLVAGINWDYLDNNRLITYAPFLIQAVALLIHQPIIAAIVLTAGFFIQQVLTPNRKGVTYVGYLYLLSTEFFLTMGMESNAGNFYTTFIGLVWQYLAGFQTFSLEPANSPKPEKIDRDEDRPFFTPLEILLIMTPFVALSATKYYLMMPIPASAFPSQEPGRIYSMPHANEWAVHDPEVAKYQTSFPECAPCQKFKADTPTQATQGKSRDLLIAVRYDDGLKGLYATVKSLRSTGCDAKVAILTNTANLKSNEKVINNLKKCGVSFIDIGEPKVKSRYQKYGMLYDFIKIYKDDFDRLIYIENPSVLFQANPFNMINNSAITLPMYHKKLSEIHELSSSLNCVRRNGQNDFNPRAAISLDYIIGNILSVRHFITQLIMSGKQGQSTEGCNVVAWFNVHYYINHFTEKVPIDFVLNTKSDKFVMLSDSQQVSGESWGSMKYNSATPALVDNALASVAMINSFNLACPSDIQGLSLEDYTAYKDK